MRTTQPDLPSSVLKLTGSSSGLSAGSDTLTDFDRSIFNCIETSAASCGGFCAGFCPAAASGRSAPAETPAASSAAAAKNRQPLVKLPRVLIAHTSALSLQGNRVLAGRLAR